MAEAVAVAVVVAVALVACGTGEDAGNSTGDTTSGTAEDAAEESGSEFEVSTDGLDAPWSVATLMGDDAPEATTPDTTALVSERDSGRILALDADGEPHEVAVLPEVRVGGEGGLLGIAVHERQLYTYFTAENGNRIERYTLEGEAGEAAALSLGEPDTVIDGLPAGSNHNGGRIAFGPDGMLYATVGDAGDTSLPQDIDSLGGKILRMTADGDVPDDNPFDNSPVYSYGHRNPQGIGWTPDGKMYSSEFGQNTWDELNVIEAGANYGWPEVEGIAEERDTGEFVDPVLQWEPADASPSGIAVTQDAVFIAALRGERLIEVPLDGHGEVTDEPVEHHVGEFGRLRDVVVAPNGEMWLVTNNTDGRGSPGPLDDRIVRRGLES
ncbi:PQQ-dependent sugar dehydrogenase [Candidatus Corynebacterium faecigallinarum]|uniref:PQQ-dependent sugar dehydrogenase n=1 Tax=Candidatus Corynebacterium faecigallinarum TaxID=2838528 RepID=UPI003FD67A07